MPPQILEYLSVVFGLRNVRLGRLFLIIKRLTIDIEVMGYYSIALDFIASVTKMQKVNKLQIVLLSSIDF